MANPSSQHTGVVAKIDAALECRVISANGTEEFSFQFQWEFDDPGGRKRMGRGAWSIERDEWRSVGQIGLFLDLPESATELNAVFFVDRGGSRDDSCKFRIEGKNIHGKWHFLADPGPGTDRLTTNKNIAAKLVVLDVQALPQALTEREPSGSGITPIDTLCSEGER